MSYRSYVPWARSYLNEKYNKNKPASEQPTNKEQQQYEQDKEDKDKKDKDKREKDTSRYSSRYGNNSTSRTPDISISSSLNSYRPGNYRPTPTLPPSSYVAPRARERSSSRERYTTTYLPKETRTPSEPYPRPTYSRSNSTLSESETPDKQSASASCRKYGTSPSRTISYSKSEDKGPPITQKTEPVASKYTTNSYTSRFLAAVGDKNQDENRYTYRTRPQPVLKNLEISIPKSEANSPLSPLSPSSRSPLSPLSPKAPSSPVKLPTSSVKTDDDDETDLPKNISCTISVVNRGTSPNQPTSYSRSRRSEIAREIQRDVARPRKRPETRNQETQTDKVEESTRFSRFGTRSTPWSSYLDRFSSTSYTPSVSRYSRYPNEPPRTSRNTKAESIAEPTTPKSTLRESPSEKLKSNISNTVTTLKSTPIPTTRNSPPKLEKKTSYIGAEPRPIEKQKSSLTERFKTSFTDTSSTLSSDRKKNSALEKQKTPSPEKLTVTSSKKLKSPSPEKLKANSPDKNKRESKISPSRIAHSIADKIRGVKTKSPEKVVKSSSKNNITKQISQDKPAKSSSPEQIGKTDTLVTTEKIPKSETPDKTNEQVIKPKGNEKIKNISSPDRDIEKTLPLERQELHKSLNSSEKSSNSKPDNTQYLSKARRYEKSQSPDKCGKDCVSENILKSKSPEKVVKVSSTDKIKRGDSTKINISQSSETSKLPKMPSKTNLTLRRTSKEETPEPLLNSLVNLKTPNVIPVTESKQSIELEENTIPRNEIKTDLNIKSETDIPSTSRLEPIDIKEVALSGSIKQSTSTTNLVSNKNSCSENLSTNDSSKSSLSREISGRLTPRRSVSREEQIVLEKTNMSTDLIVGPMKILAPKQRVPTPRDMLEDTSSNDISIEEKKVNSVMATEKSSEEGKVELVPKPAASDASSNTIPSAEKSPTINRKPPPSPKLISKPEKLSQQSSKSKNIKPSLSQNTIPIIKVANKDFRKSPLNMSTGEMKDVTKIEVAMTKRACSEGSSPLCPHKPLKSLSKISLDERSISESNEEIIKNSSRNAQKRSISRSSSQLQSHSSSNANLLEHTESSSDLSFKSSSGDLLKNKEVSIPIVVETIQHPGSCTQFIRHSRSLRRNSSSTTSSSSDTSSEEESDEDSNDCDQFKPQNKDMCEKIGTCNVMLNKYPVEGSAASTSEDISSISLDKTTDKISKATIDKPPLPPNSRAKDDNKPTSFLMRALAPVTNFLWVNKKHDSSEKSPTALSAAEESRIKRSNTSQSISEIHDHSESLDISNKSDIDIDEKLDNYKALENQEINKGTHKISADATSKTHTLKDIATWLSTDEKDNTQHQFKYISKSSENITSENIERNLSFRSLPGRKSRPVSCEIGWWLKDDENDKPLPDQIEAVDLACAEPADRDEQKSPIIFRSPSGEHEFSLNGAGDISEYSSSSEGTESSESEEEISEPKPPIRINFKRAESGERAWWLQSTDNVPEGISRMKSTTSLHKEDRNDENESKEEQIHTEQNFDAIRDGIKREHSSASISEVSKTARRFKLRHIESGEKAWWMESSENIPAGIQRDPSTPSESITTTEEDQGAIRYRIRPQQSGERAWWMQSTENIPDGIKRNESSKSISKSSKSSQSRKLRRIESSDKPWWVNSQENVALNEGLKRNDSLRAGKPPDGLKRSGSTRSTDSRPRRIRHIESGERAWWMDSTDNVPEGITKLEPDSPPQETESKLHTNELLSQTSGDRAWWLKSTDNVPEAQTIIETETTLQEEEPKLRWHNLRPQQSGDRPWWLDSNANIPDGITQLTPSTSESESTESESEEEEDEILVSANVPKFPLELGDRTSPDGLEGHNIRTSGRESPYDNVTWLGSGEEETIPRVTKKMHLFIGSHTNIDDILGAGEAPAEQTPIDVGVKELAEKFQLKTDTQEIQDTSSEEEAENEADQLKQEMPAAEITARRRRSRATEEPEEPTTAPQEAAGLEPSTGEKLDDVALQLYKDGDYGSYLDLEASLSEQQEEFEDFHLNRKNSIVLRTQLSVRVHTIIEKLLKSEGRELRRALFSLKQIFQEDKDLVHEFVQNDGLACLIKVGSEADQNYQNYILRALGQVMLYVDGMNGVMAHNETVQWLYALISSRFRLVVKTALKLLLVFIEYKESNCMLLIKAIKAEDTAKNQSPWSNMMRLLSDYDTSDTELLVYASSLINKTLNGIPDQDTYYDQVDALEEQGMEGIIQRYMSRQGTDLDLLRQFQIYEAVLHHEDGEEKGTPVKLLDEAIRKTLRNRKSSSSADSPNERRKSRRHASLTSPTKNGLSNGSGPHLICSPIKQQQQQQDDDEGSSSSRSSPSPSLVGEMRHLNGGSYADNNKANVGVTPALRRRRERTERQRNFIREQQETAAILRKSSSGDIGVEDDKNNVDAENRQPPSRTPSRQDILMNAVNSELDAKDGGTDERSKVMQLNRENTVKDLTQKLANSMLSPTSEQINRSIGDMTGIISKAMEGLAKSKSKGDLKPTEKIVPEIKKSETEIQWENILENMQRPLTLCDLDFTDLHSDDEMDILAPHFVANGIPPPPPPLNSVPPPPSGSLCAPPPPPNRFNAPPAPPGAFGVNLKHYSQYQTESPATPTDKSVKKSKKTLKLFWKEVREDPAILSKLQKLGQNLIWDELSPVSVDTQKLEHLFESRAKDINPKTKQEMNKTKEVIVLDPKRSNAINIGMTKLPPPRAIKTAILKMDSTVMNREGIEKLFAMLPTEEERSRIQEAQVANPDIPLGSAEQFLLTMASITELPARLKLWAFKLDYENIEKEIAEPVMDLKQGMEILKSNRTFRCILGTLLSIGIFLNGNEVKGFQIEYLAKVPEVKDTVHKHSLLHHLCHMVMEKFPESTDLYSEIGAVTRASKVDFDELANNINRLENECKASWDHLKVIAKHDGASVTKNKMSEFLTDCAQRIMVLSIVHRRIMNRFHKFLLWLGTPPHRIQDTKPNEFCRIVSEFALEYRTTRERVLQQLEKKANHRERNKTRGKMITEVGKFRSKETDRADAELRQLLGGDMSETESLHGTWRRQRKDLGGRTAEQTWPKSAQCRLNSLLRDEAMSEHMTDGDDEILESLVKTATKTPVARTTPRERKRTRHADLKRSRTRENCPDEASYSNK